MYSNTISLRYFFPRARILNEIAEFEKMPLNRKTLLNFPVDIEDITLPQEDMNFIFSCWEYLSRMSATNEWEILSAREDKVRIPKRPCNVLFII